LKEAILKETQEKIEGGNVEASIDIDSISWKSEKHSLNACVGSSTYKSGEGKVFQHINVFLTIVYCYMFVVCNYGYIIGIVPNS